MYRIRKAQLSDARDLHKLETKTWGMEVTTAWDIATFIRFGEVIVAYRADELIGGLTSIYAGKNLLYVADMFVAVEHRRRRVGSKLYQRLFRAVPDHTIVTDVSVLHSEAHFLHEHLGFRKVRLERNWYALGDQDEPRLIYQYQT